MSDCDSAEISYAADFLRHHAHYLDGQWSWQSEDMEQSGPYALVGLVILAMLGLPFLVVWAKDSSAGMMMLIVLFVVLSMCSWAVERRQ